MKGMTVEELVEKLLLMPQHLEVKAEIDFLSAPVTGIYLCVDGRLNDRTPVKVDPPILYILTD